MSLYVVIMQYPVSDKSHHSSFLMILFQDKFEVQKCAVKKGQKVIIIDDLLATGGKYLTIFNMLNP